MSGSELAAGARAAGVVAWAHAVDVDTGREVGLHPDTPVVAASVFKVPVLVELCCQYASGAIDPQARVRVAAGQWPVAGGTGLSVFSDDVELSVRDLALLMMSVSDNRATDVIIDLVGLDAINARMVEAGLPDTVLEADCTGLFAAMDADLGGSWRDYVGSEPDGALLRTMRVVVPETTNRTTPRETTTLLRALWRDDGFPPSACAEARRILGLQAWPHRLGSGFPEATTRLSGKTGTLAFLRSEAGVVETAEGRRIAVAVFTSSTSSAARNPAADAAIGAIARRAADLLTVPD